MLHSYSVNQLKTWEKCQKRYELNYARRLSWPSDPKNFRLGRGVHQLLDYDARHMPVDPIAEAADADIRAYWEQLRQSRWAQLPVVASEWGFALEVAGHWIYGRIDRIAQDEHRIHVLDWKTGTGIPFHPETDWQTLVYLYAVYAGQADLGLTFPPEYLYFTYVQAKPSGITEVQVAYSQQRHAETHARLTQTLIAMSQATRFKLPSKCPDRYCPYINICGVLDQLPPSESDTVEAYSA